MIDSNRHHKPYHIRLAEYKQARERIFSTAIYAPAKPRSAKRMHDYWQRHKFLKRYVISPIVYDASDIRPYANIEIFGKNYLGLLDSGANKSCIGSELARSILDNEVGVYKKCRGSVKTADGKRQMVAGIITMSITFNNQQKEMEFLIVPTVTNDVICGMDFWQIFGVKVCAEPMVNQLSLDEESDALHLTPTQQQQLELATSAFPSSEKEGLGVTTLIEHHIDTGSATPVKQRYYPISPAREKILCEEIDRMLSLGVIEEAKSSPWSSPGVLSSQAWKSKVLFRLKEASPIPNIDGLLSRLPPVNCVSKIDLKDAFWQINLSRESRPKTAFTIPNRPLYQFKRMPFGLCNAPQTMCRLMDQVIPYHLKTHVFVYLDDLLIPSQSFEEHVTHLMEVACQLRKAGLTINIKKSSFGLCRVKYLGFLVGDG